MSTGKTINRRSAIKAMGVLGIANSLAYPDASAQGRTADSFAYAGGSTPLETVKTALDANIVNGLGMTIDYEENAARMTSLDGYKLLITMQYRPFTEAQENMIQTFLRNGGGALFLHNSTDLARQGTPVLRDIMGGYWLEHTEIRPYRVRISNRNHPITRGVNNFEVTGEHHYNQYDKDPRYVFLTNESIDGWSYNNIEGDKHFDSRIGDIGFGPSCASGWAYDYGQGRVCFMAPGHTLEILTHPEYVKLQQNAVRWLLKQI